MIQFRLVSISLLKGSGQQDHFQNTVKIRISLTSIDSLIVDWQDFYFSILAQLATLRKWMSIQFAISEILRVVGA